MLLAGDKRLGIDAQELAERPQELRRAVQADRRLQIGAVERLAEEPSKLAVKADVDLGLGKARHVLDVAAERKDHVDLGADPLDQPPDLREIGGHVEHAVNWADDVNLGFCASSASLLLGDAALLRAELAPEPRHGAVGALPLVLVYRAGKEPLKAGAFRRHAAADHLGDRTGHDDARQIGIERGVSALHRALGAMPPELFLGEAGYDDRQFVRRQRVGIVQHRRHRQILAADRTVDDDL